MSRSPNPQITLSQLLLTSAVSNSRFPFQASEDKWRPHTRTNLINYWRFVSSRFPPTSSHFSILWKCFNLQRQQIMNVSRNWKKCNNAINKKTSSNNTKRKTACLKCTYRCCNPNLCRYHFCRHLISLAANKKKKNY